MDMRIMGFRIYSAFENIDVTTGETQYGAMFVSNAVYADVTIDVDGLGIVEKKDIRLSLDAVKEIVTILQNCIMK